MTFLGDMVMDISCTEKYIVTIEINQCSFYGNIFQYSINSLTYCDITQKLFNQSSLLLWISICVVSMAT